MMTDRFDNSSLGDDDGDRQLRQLLSGLPPEDLPAGVETQVFSRISRRRLISRVLYAGAAVAVITAVGLSARWNPGHDTPETLITEVPHAAMPSPQDLLDGNLIPVSLATPPPVDPLGVIAKNQFAMLECLKSLKGEDL